MKRTLETTVDPEVLKKARLDVFLMSNELPHFKFNFNIMYNTLSGISLADWVAMVDMQKKELNWSDHTTIQKVLACMQAMPEVHTWFSSIGDIMTWDEWKTKLLKAFPGPDDYCLFVKKALKRKKKPEESFCDYLKDKTEILEKADITGKKAVSFIIHGIAHHDALIYCLARIGGYESPQDLVDYFKKCDEKAAMSDGATETSATSEKKVKTTPKGQAQKNKGKCYKCSKPGHFAIECTQGRPMKFKPTPFKPTSQVARPKTQQMVVANKKYPPVPCKFCGKYGHKTRVCPFARLEKLKQTQQGTAKNHVSPFIQPADSNQSTSRPPVAYSTYSQQPVAYSTPDPSPSAQLYWKKCGYCHKHGHTSEECYIANRKATANEQKWSNNSAKPKWGDDGKLEPFETECANCGSIKHLSRYCGKNKPNMEDMPEKSTLRCKYCRSHRHLSEDCHLGVSPDRSSGNKYEHPQQKQLCFLCYQIGHKKANCPLNRKWSYME